MKITKGIRWTVIKAAPEFGIHRETLAKRIKNVGIVAGKDGCFSTDQICRAVYGDYEGERLRKVREEADQIALENDQTRKTLVDLGYFSSVWDAKMVRLKQMVEMSGLSHEQQTKFLNEAADLLNPFTAGQGIHNKPDTLSRDTSAAPKAAA